ncbi:hypothetical protein N9O57_00730 [bacterium]|nr:hypothetical protein [bacterium]
MGLTKYIFVTVIFFTFISIFSAGKRVRPDSHGVLKDLSFYLEPELLSKIRSNEFEIVKELIFEAKKLNYSGEWSKLLAYEFSDLKDKKKRQVFKSSLSKIAGPKFKATHYFVEIFAGVFVLSLFLYWGLKTDRKHDLQDDFSNYINLKNSYSFVVNKEGLIICASKLAKSEFSLRSKKWEDFYKSHIVHVNLADQANLIYFKNRNNKFFEYHSFTRLIDSQAFRFIRLKESTADFENLDSKISKERVSTKTVKNTRQKREKTDDQSA